MTEVNKSIEQRLTCVRKAWVGSHPCGKPAKWLLDLGGPAKVPLCGIHARTYKGSNFELERIK